MINRIVVLALILGASAAPAMAGTAAAPQLPEPTTTALFGLAAGGAYLAKRYLKRK